MPRASSRPTVLATLRAALVAKASITFVVVVSFSLPFERFGKARGAAGTRSRCCHGSLLRGRSSAI